jgi:serine/threonine protein kinase
MSLPADSSPPGELYCPACEKTFQVGDRCPNDGTRLVRIAIRIDPFLGRDLDGNYTILEKLGEGGMGAVYRASQHSVGREVAIKVVSAHLVSEPDVIKRFLREAKLASRLSHPNAVGVIDFGQTDDGVFYLVMELVAGRTLDNVIKADRVFKPERVVRIGTQVCDALEGAHALQIVHRDLKPANIMLLASGRDLVKVLDFGLAKSVAPDQASTTMTNAGALLGTPAFIPPELALGHGCDGRADLYSLGVVLFLLGTGRLPFVSDSVHELIAMHANEKAPPMTGVPAALSRVIDRLLAKDPAHRYQSAAETREALEAALENRYLTPAPHETSPSVGPFPLTTSAIMGHYADPGQSQPFVPHGAPKPRSMTEMSRLVSSETIAALDSSPGPAAFGTTPVPAGVPGSMPRSRRPLVIGLSALFVCAIAAIIAVSLSNPESTDKPRAADQPAASTPTPPQTEKPTMIAPAQPQPPPQTAGSAAPVPTPPPPESAGSAEPKALRPPKHGSRVPKGSKQPQHDPIQTTPPPPPPVSPPQPPSKPPQVTGSDMPF